MMRLLVATVTTLGIATSVTAAPKAGPQKMCVLKGGEATGISRAFAEYEALLIIRQVTGNWPIESDRIDQVTYRCRQDGAASWTCKASARVCRR